MHSARGVLHAMLLPALAGGVVDHTVPTKQQDPIGGCASGDDCIVRCTGKDWCKHSSLAPKPRYLYLVCTGETACEGMYFDMTGGDYPDGISIVCSGKQACKSIDLICSTGVQCQIRCDPPDSDESCKNTNCQPTACDTLSANWKPVTYKSMPTASPSSAPTRKTVAPTRAPSSQPTSAPTRPPRSPTQPPSASPTASPTQPPSASPTASPTQSPSASPTASPTQSPSASPTAKSNSISFRVTVCQPHKGSFRVTVCQPNASTFVASNVGAERAPVASAFGGSVLDPERGAVGSAECSALAAARPPHEGSADGRAFRVTIHVAFGQA
eukprot:TRINITY_DN4167_c0_g1_i1.p2 TRINITY_DN4167_c0_g1~~TRINITY_DN4167_c0_g1_i1.p2  ORF type:complete len:327 (+),score=37.77 TRINITY_DN4167_c0_g1_i1:71-1051(+)